MLSKPRRKIIRRKGKKTLTKRRTFRPARDVGDFASCSVRRTLAGDAGGNFNTNQMYDMRQISLNTFLRAMTIAKAYQHYRITKVTLTLKPTFDSYVSGGGGANGTRPNLYYMIDKSGSIPAAVTLEGLKQMGAKPHRFDEKPFSISWRPSVLTADQNNALGVDAGQYKISPFLSTSENDINHLGIFWYVDQLLGPPIAYQAEMEVQFQFKKPLWGSVSGQTVAYSVKPAIEDDSKDGVVGGADAQNT